MENWDQYAAANSFQVGEVGSRIGADSPPPPDATRRCPCHTSPTTATAAHRPLRPATCRVGMTACRCAAGRASRAPTTVPSSRCERCGSCQHLDRGGWGGGCGREAQRSLSFLAPAALDSAHPPPFFPPPAPAVGRGSAVLAPCGQWARCRRPWASWARWQHWTFRATGGAWGCGTLVAGWRRAGGVRARGVRCHARVQLYCPSLYLPRDPYHAGFTAPCRSNGARWTCGRSCRTST